MKIAFSPFLEVDKRKHREENEPQIHIGGDGQFHDDGDGKKQQYAIQGVTGVQPVFEISEDQPGCQQCKCKMNIFRQDVVSEIERSGVKQVYIHGKIRKLDSRNFINSPMFQVQFGNIEMVCQRISIDRGDGSENADGNGDRQDERDANGMNVCFHR